MASELPTKKQRELLRFITEFIAEHGYAPSYREVMRAREYKSVSTVAKHIDNLITRGWLVKRDNSARSITVADNGGEQGNKPENSPTPSLSHDDWLAERITKRLSDGNDDGTTVQEINKVLEFLGLTTVRDRIDHLKV